MKKYFLSQSIFAIALASLALNTAQAKPINLHEQPKTDSKIVGTVDSATGVITIFTPKTGDWVKVANPTDGNVGWIKATELSHTGFRFNVLSTGDGAQGYQIIQYGNMQPYTPEQFSQTMKKIQLQQQTWQKDTQQIMENLFKSMQQSWFPMILPVVVLPEKMVSPQPAKK